MKYTTLNISILMILAVLFSTSCAISVSTPKISSLLLVEEKLIEPLNPSFNTNNRLNKVLLSSLNELNLPNDYAKLTIIQNGLPAMFSGIGNDIYITRNLINSFSIGKLKKNQMKLLLMHEILHKLKNHPYITLSKVSLKLRRANLFDVAAKVAIASIIYQKKYTSITSMSDYYNLYSSPLEALLGESKNNELGFKPRYGKGKSVAQFPLTGYIYPKKLEFEVDDAIIRELHKKGKEPFSYIKSLIALKKLIKIASPKLDNFDASHLESRISRLIRKESRYE